MRSAFFRSADTDNNLDRRNPFGVSLSKSVSLGERSKAVSRQSVAMDITSAP